MSKDGYLFDAHISHPLRTAASAMVVVVVCVVVDSVVHVYVCVPGVVTLSVFIGNPPPKTRRR